MGYLKSFHTSNIEVSDDPNSINPVRWTPVYFDQVFLQEKILLILKLVSCDPEIHVSVTKSIVCEFSC